MFDPTDNEIEVMIHTILANPNPSVAARACINALQIMLGGADAITLDEDASGEISSIVIGTADLIESTVDWAEHRTIELDYLEGLSELGMEDMN
jgi:hypothetical protein